MNSKRIKVMFFTLRSKTFAGSAKAMLNLINSLPIEPFVVISKKGVFEKKLNYVGIKHYHIPYFSQVVNTGKHRRKRYLVNASIKNTVKHMINQLSYIRLLCLMRKERPDIVHINDLLCGEIPARVARKLEIPYIWHVRCSMEKGLGLQFSKQEFMRETIRSANQIIAVSKALKNEYEEIWNCPISVIYDYVLLNRPMARKKLALEQKIINLLIAGVITEVKGHYDAIHAIETLVKRGNTNFKLTILGVTGRYGEYEEQVIEYVERNNLGKYIEFAPFTQDVESWYEKSDIGLMCSRYEGFGFVTVEYMLSNMLVIGADAGGTLELVIHQETGLLYNAGDGTDLADKILYAVSHKEEMCTIIENAKYFAEQEFSTVQFINKMQTIYDDAIKSGKRLHFDYM